MPELSRTIAGVIPIPVGDNLFSIHSRSIARLCIDFNGEELSKKIKNYYTQSGIMDLKDCQFKSTYFGFNENGTVWFADAKNTNVK